ncbi:hypothetical protein DACRYDRAFT_23090 [Dacryopinax primogenitus]|uniref:Uncharacterized protein n=1 Tax=Dacryopinax primogenitus (strain DJM 731) TaxID=1858805 RepID=M5G4I4_DACPD|nr:uncharacterized protein DACRYDRAFT_23090 [Dacryopinax primogenitus]EJU00737.1 hypothetical protein DACRYDRAFT_23090 [Dacryopinax primogenitus]
MMYFYHIEYLNGIISLLSTPAAIRQNLSLLQTKVSIILSLASDPNKEEKEQKNTLSLAFHSLIRTQPARHKPLGREWGLGKIWPPELSKGGGCVRVTRVHIRGRPWDTISIEE